MTNHHSFDITVYYDDKQVTRSQGTTDIEGWDNAPHQLVKAQVVARELHTLAAKWATIEADETTKYQATLTDGPTRRSPGTKGDEQTLAGVLFRHNGSTWVPISGIPTDRR